MRKLRIFVVELVLVAVLVGWYVWKFPETLDPLIPWILWAIFAHLTWEILLEREGVKLYVGKAVEGARRSAMIWLLAFVVGGCISMGYLWLAKVSVRKLTAFGISHSPKAAESVSSPEVPAEVREKTPSFLFIIGAPLGDNESATWIMLARHYGPDRAYDCQLEFFDQDRMNIESLWRTAHNNAPFNPPGMFDASQARMHIPEAGPESGTAASFKWNPLDPNRQHYTMNIDCRDGYFVETWQITRVNGILRSKIVVEHGIEWGKKNPGKNRMIFQYADPEFVATDLLTAIPKREAKYVHPGWKPGYKFAFPVAIINPNGRINILSGIKQPDGSTRTDFGSWNLLTKHLGDESTKRP